ncbi:MAG: hypothetical protein AB2598_20835 [Candidatus Thiodiazotropha sp.]
MKSYKAPTGRLPGHLEEDGQDVVEKWNKDSAALRTSITESQHSLSDAVELLLSKIMKGEDGASATLNAIFSSAYTPSEGELNNARLRKELGNPPGKPADAVGDQISWEQLLSAYGGEHPLWIISSDNDYSSKVNSKRYLNAYLYEELKKQIGKEPEVYVFETLAEGIEHYSEHRKTPVENLPTKEELKKIAAKELMERKEWGFSHGFPEPIVCFKCGEKKGFRGPVPKPSQYGGWTYQWLCNACHQWNDFGESYED